MTVNATSRFPKTMHMLHEINYQIASPRLEIRTDGLSRASNLARRTINAQKKMGIDLVSRTARSITSFDSAARDTKFNRKIKEHNEV